MSFFFSNSHRKSKVSPIFDERSAESLIRIAGRSTTGRNTTSSRMSRFTTSRSTATRKTSTFELSSIYQKADDFTVGIQEILGKFKAIKFDSARKTHYINVPPKTNSVSSCMTADSEQDTRNLSEELFGKNESIRKNESYRSKTFLSRIAGTNSQSKNDILKSSYIDRLMLHCSTTFSTFKVTTREPIFSCL